MIEILESASPILTEELWALCNKMDWFTAGTNSQYEKLFDLNREGASLDELALVIWLCTPDQTREGILSTLKKEYGGAL